LLVLIKWGEDAQAGSTKGRGCASRLDQRERMWLDQRERMRKHDSTDKERMRSTLDQRERTGRRSTDKERNFLLWGVTYLEGPQNK